MTVAFAWYGKAFTSALQLCLPCLRPFYCLQYKAAAPRQFLNRPIRSPHNFWKPFINLQPAVAGVFGRTCLVWRLAVFAVAVSRLAFCGWRFVTFCGWLAFRGLRFAVDVWRLAFCVFQFCVRCFPMDIFAVFATANNQISIQAL